MRPAHGTHLMISDPWKVLDTVGKTQVSCNPAQVRSITMRWWLSWELQKRHDGSTAACLRQGVERSISY